MLTCVLELVVLKLVASFIGVGATIVVGLLSAIVGVWLMHYEGLRVWRAFQQSLVNGEMPSEGIIDGLLVLLGGTLFVVPGIVTDVVGLVLLIPVSRRAVAHIIRARLARKMQKNMEQMFSPSGGGVRCVRFHQHIDDEPIDSPFDLFASPFDAGVSHGFDRGFDGSQNFVLGDRDVIDTRGVEVQDTLLLGQGPSVSDSEPVDIREILDERDERESPSDSEPVVDDVIKTQGHVLADD